MIKKFLTKLVGWREKETNFSARTFKSAEGSRDAQEGHGQITAGREQKYVSEVTTPTEGDLRGPSDSISLEEKKETSK